MMNAHEYFSPHIAISRLGSGTTLTAEKVEAAAEAEEG